MGRIARWLGARPAPWIVIAIAIGLAAPALTADFTADDQLHRILARAEPGIAGLRSRPLDLFVFASDGSIACDGREFRALEPLFLHLTGEHYADLSWL